MMFKIGDEVIVHRPKTKKEQDQNPKWLSHMDIFNKEKGVITSFHKNNSWVKLKLDKSSRWYFWFHIAWLEKENFNFLTRK